MKLTNKALVFAAAMAVGAASARAGPCPCNGDVSDDGIVDLIDLSVALACIEGDCSGCVNSCDLNCDGEVDFCDLEIMHCQFFAGPGGDPTCCDTVACGACCLIDATCTPGGPTSCPDFAGGTYQGDDTVCDPDPCNGGGPVPTVSEWSLVAMAF